MERSPSVFQRHRRKVLFGLVVAMIVIADLGGTALLRWTGIYVPTALSEASFRTEHPVYHHGLRPSHAAPDTAVWGDHRYDLFTNSLGFKDARVRDVPLEPDSSTERIVFLGDSFTEGVGIEYPQTFVGRLDERLRSTGVEVLNAGVASYSPAIYAQKARHLLDDVGLRFHRLVVFLDVSDIVDEVENYDKASDGTLTRRPIELEERFKNFVRDHTILLGAMRRFVRVARASTEAGPSAFDRTRSAWTRVPELRARFADEGLSRACRHLDELRATLARHEISMTLAVYPWPDQIAHAEHECVQVTYWRDWCSERGVEFWNLFPLFLDAGEPKDVVARYFIPGDVHWNDAGHARLADAIEKRL